MCHDSSVCKVASHRQVICVGCGCNSKDEKLGETMASDDQIEEPRETFAPFR